MKIVLCILAVFISVFVSCSDDADVISYNQSDLNGVWANIVKEDGDVSRLIITNDSMRELTISGE